jgi:hypothetical protein
MTTTVHSPNIPFVEACAAIPAVWDNVAHERDRLRKSGAQGDGEQEVPAPKRHSLCGKCMTPHICAEDGPGCKPADGVKEGGK